MVFHTDLQETQLLVNHTANQQDLSVFSKDKTWGSTKADSSEYINGSTT